jgi:hypothetical protein
MNTRLGSSLLLGILVTSNHTALQAAPGRYQLNDNVAPGALVMESYAHRTLTQEMTPYYGYYQTVFPSMNDLGVVVGRTDKAHSSYPLIKGRDTGETASWTNGSVTNLEVC